MPSITRLTRTTSILAFVLGTFACSNKDHPAAPYTATPAGIIAQTSTTISAVVGTVVSPAPAVQVFSVRGLPVPNVSVSFTVAAASGTVRDTAATTDANGVATAGQWTLGTTAGQQQLTASVVGLPPVVFTAAAGPDVPASVVPNDTTQALGGLVGTNVATLPAAMVRDRYGNPVSGVAVSFAVTQGGGSVTGANDTTDASGIARPASWTLGPAAGANILTASVIGIASPAIFTVTAAEGPPSALAFVAGSGQSATVNTAIAVPPAVRVTDSYGNPVAGQIVSFSAGTGSVTNASAVSGADGVASPGAWTLGTTAGANSLDAKLGKLSATLTAVGLAGPASALVTMSSLPGSLAVATSVTPKPSVRVTDAYANVIAGASVAFTVQSGGGTVTGGSVTSDATGIATVGAWTLGTHPGTQTLRASVGTSVTLDFNVNVVAGPPAQMLLVAGSNQYGRVGTVLPVSPAVQVMDKYSNAVVGGTVTFTTMGASGSVSGGNTTTNAQGQATLGAWTLGSAEGMDSVYVSAAPGLWLPIYARVVPISQFNITLRYLTPMTATQQAAFQRAAERWRDVVIGDLTDMPMTLPANACGMNEPALNETVDDLLIYVSVDSIDGPGNVLGSAAPCYTRNSNGLPVIGFMHFDVADVAQLQANNQLDDVIRHEMGHVLGVGSLWQSFGLLAGAGTSDPYFTGASGRQEFSAVGGNAYIGNAVPVENVGGQGTVNTHWRESVLRTELMTGYTSPPGVRMPLSLVTIGSLEDLGYTITPWGYDVFTFGVDLRSSVETPGHELRELAPPRAPIALDDGGRVVAQPRLWTRARGTGRRVDLARNAPRQLQSVTRRE